VTRIPIGELIAGVGAERLPCGDAGEEARQPREWRCFMRVRRMFG